MFLLIFLFETLEFMYQIYALIIQNLTFKGNTHIVTTLKKIKFAVPCQLDNMYSLKNHKRLVGFLPKIQVLYIFLNNSNKKRSLYLPTGGLKITLPL